MISTLLRVFFINLRRDRVVWLLTFVVPVAFFSIFALIFGSQERGGTPTIHVAVVDEDDSDFTKSLLAAMENEKSLRVANKIEVEGGRDGQSRPLTRQDAEALVRDGKVAAAVIFPKKLGESFPSFAGNRPTVELLADSSDPVAPQMLGGMLQGLVMTAAPDSLMKGGLQQLEKWGGALTPEQRKAVDKASQFLNRPAKEKNEGAAASGLLDVKIIDLIGQTKANPVVAFYAAATAVMFLLFACANGAGGSLIEELENGTLDRLLSSNMSMTQLLLGKWVSFILLGMIQVTVMFLWGWLVFKVELWSHLAGFFAMTIVTSAAAAAFGIMLGTFCHTRGQLAGVSTTVILLMSAIGGSMFPRFAMSEGLQKVGLLTFNAWALDGYQKVFWRDAPVWDLWPQLLVLAGLTCIFLSAARWIGARKWETV